MLQAGRIVLNCCPTASQILITMASVMLADIFMFQYTYLLTSQLEAQRLFYEERIEHIEKQALKQVRDSHCNSLIGSEIELQHKHHALQTSCY